MTCLQNINHAESIGLPKDRIKKTLSWWPSVTAVLTVDNAAPPQGNCDLQASSSSLTSLTSGVAYVNMSYIGVYQSIKTYPVNKPQRDRVRWLHKLKLNKNKMYDNIKTPHKYVPPDRCYPGHGPLGQTLPCTNASLPLPVRLALSRICARTSFYHDLLWHTRSIKCHCFTVMLCISNVGAVNMLPIILLGAMRQWLAEWWPFS